MSDIEEEDDMMVDEAELFGATQPIAPLSPLGPLEINDVPNSQNGLLADIPVEDTSNAEKNKDEGKAKKVRKPRITLNEDRLTGKNGIRQLPEMFKGVKFKGKGWEKEDLGLLLRKAEHWAHDMIPRSQFVDVVDRLEFLGTKKRVKTHALLVKRGELLLDEGEDDNPIGEEENRNDDGGRTENGMIEGTPANANDEGTNTKSLDEIGALLNADFGDIEF